MKIAQDAFDALLYLGRHNLEKRRARAPWLLLIATVVNPRFDYFPGVRSLDDRAFLRRMAS